MSNINNPGYSLLTSPALDDIIPIVDVSDPSMNPVTGTTKRVTVSRIRNLDWINLVQDYNADPTGVADSTAALNSAIAAAAGKTIYIPAGTYLLNSTAPSTISSQGTVITGDGPNSTIIKIGASFSGAQVFNTTAGYCQISNLSIVGASSTITSNPVCNGILLQGGRFCRVMNVFFQYINGWCIEAIPNGASVGFATQITNVSGLQNAGGIHLKSTSAASWGGQFFLSDINLQQIGVGTGGSANLDSIRFEDIYDVTGVNFNVAVSDASTGSAISILGKCAVMYLTNTDLGCYPNASSETNSVISIADSANGSPSDIRFVQGIAQQGKYGLNISGGAQRIWFISYRFFNNYSHGALVTSTGSEIEFFACGWSLNGQGASGTNYDLEWTGSSTGDVTSCRFSSAVVAVSSAGVQNPMDFAGAGVVTVKDCNAYGSGTTSTNVFSSTPKYVYRTLPWNPHGATTISVPSSGSATAGRSFDMYFYITAGTSTCTCVVTPGGPSIVIPANGFATVFVPAGSTMTPTYTNAPTWVVYGN